MQNVKQVFNTKFMNLKTFDENSLFKCPRWIQQEKVCYNFQQYNMEIGLYSSVSYTCLWAACPNTDVCLSHLVCFDTASSLPVSDQRLGSSRWRSASRWRFARINKRWSQYPVREQKSSQSNHALFTNVFTSKQYLKWQIQYKSN